MQFSTTIYMAVTLLIGRKRNFSDMRNRQFISELMKIIQAGSGKVIFHTSSEAPDAGSWGGSLRAQLVWISPLKETSLSVSLLDIFIGFSFLNTPRFQHIPQYKMPITNNNLQWEWQLRQRYSGIIQICLNVLGAPNTPTRIYKKTFVTIAG